MITKKLQHSNRIECIDCIKGMQLLASNSIPLVFADPPYNINYEYDIYDDKKPVDEYLAWSLKWGAEIHRILSPTGTFWLAMGDDLAAEMKVLFHRELGFYLRSWVVWYYTFGVNCTNKLTRSHTHFFYFTKDPRSFTFNVDQLKVPSARQLIYNDKRAKKGGRLPDDTFILRPQDVPDGFVADSDTWAISRVAGTFKERAGFHGCQMPERILGRIIRGCSHPGEVVLDPFLGTGVTAVVAKKLGRSWIGFDISGDYVEQAQSRIRLTRVGEQLAGAEYPGGK